MFNFFRKRKINKYVEKASIYVRRIYEPEIRPEEKSPSVKYSRCLDSESIRYSDKNDSTSDSFETKFSERRTPTRKSEDMFNELEVSSVLRNYSTAGNYNETIYALEKNVNLTFVDKLLYYINRRGLRDSEVYKAAQVDKRLFSKIVTNRDYKPAKDTAIALALALELTLEEANDLLSRA